MNYTLLKDLLDLVQAFESDQSNARQYPPSIAGFRSWLCDQEHEVTRTTVTYENQDKGRSPESVVNTLLVHLNRYAKTYSKAAIHDSPFSTQDEFSYLITLQAFGAMGKMELIKKNIQDKPTGMQIINRLIDRGWVSQKDSPTDKRSRIIAITKKGAQTLLRQMDQIRLASRIVTGNLTHNEKNQLIQLLSKLDAFHQPIFSQNLSPDQLLATAQAELFKS